MLPGLLPPPVRGTDLLAAAQESTNPWSVGGLMRDIYNVAQCDLECVFVTLVWHVMYECMNEGMVAVFISKTHATKLPRLGP